MPSNINSVNIKNKRKKRKIPTDRPTDPNFFQDVTLNTHQYIFFFGLRLIQILEATHRAKRQNIMVHKTIHVHGLALCTNYRLQHEIFEIKHQILHCCTCALA